MVRIFKSTKTGGCPICQQYPGMEHNCMFEQEQARYITAGVDPTTHQVFNWYLAQQAARKDQEIRNILNNNFQSFQEEMARRSIRVKLPELVVPSYNRLQSYLNQHPELRQRAKLSRRDKILLG